MKASVRLSVNGHQQLGKDLEFLKFLHFAQMSLPRVKITIVINMLIVLKERTLINVFAKVQLIASFYVTSSVNLKISDGYEGDGKKCSKIKQPSPTDPPKTEEPATDPTQPTVFDEKCSVEEGKKLFPIKGQGNLTCKVSKKKTSCKLKCANGKKVKAQDKLKTSTKND